MAGKPELQAVIQGNGLFTQQLYNILSKEEGNVFFSPISAHAVLSMAFQGSKGATHDALSKSLSLSNTSVAAKGYQDIINNLNNVRKVELSMANKIFIMDGYKLNTQFQKVTKKNFLSEVKVLNFANSANAAKTINDWVEKKTKNKIKDLIKSEMLDELTRLVLVNAIYFKGEWASKFNPNRTKSEKFYLNDDDFVNVQMMNAQKDYFYKEDKNLDAKVLKLPYLNRDLSLIVILPNKRNGITELEKKLAETDLTMITQNMYEFEVIVKLPKFKIETTIDLSVPLKEMGLSVIFDKDRADFSEMLKSPERLYVSQVIQKAFIEMNEKGTEAAAATAMGVPMFCSGRIYLEEPKNFYADHTFAFILAYKQSTVLFIGRISAPQKN